MVSGNNSIINQAGNAKKQTDIAEEKEILEQATVVAIGKSKYGNVEKDELEKVLNNVAKNKTNISNVGSKIYIEFIKSKRFYKIDADGSIVDLGENYTIPTPITAKELYNQEDTSYIGAFVINYDCKNNDGIDTDIDKKWQLLYADEENIYIIASQPILFNYVPTGRNGTEVIRTGSEDSSAPNYAIKCSSIIADYNGSEDITDINLQKLNEDYFITNNYESSSKRLKATAYMLDTSENVWGLFAGKYAQYAIGGPSLDLLCKSYNKKNNTNILQTKAVSEEGYNFSVDAGSTWRTEYYKSGGTTFVSNPVFGSGTYLLATPNPTFKNQSWSDCYLFYVGYSNDMLSYNDIYGRRCGLRPVVCLKSDVYLEKKTDGNFSIIEY